METVLRVTALALLISASFAQTPAACNSYNSGAVTPKVTLPSLPANAFKTSIRATIINKNYTVEAREYVDETYNAATIVLMQAGQEQRIIMHYATNEIFYMSPDPSSTLLSPSTSMCLTANLSTDDNTQLFGMSSSASGHQHLFSTSKILNFINGTEVYKGRSVMNGVNVNRWTSCLYWPQLNANFTMDYYFSVPGWQTPGGLDQVPVMAEIQGVSHGPNGTVSIFHHIYQYLDFEAYVSDPESIFETPPGVWCIGRQAVKQPPKLNNHFYYREEIVSPTENGPQWMVSENDIWYDYDMQLVRYDQRNVPDGVSNPFTQSNGPYTVIHDFATGVQYTIANDVNLCSIDPIPLSSKSFDAVNGTGQTLTLRNPWQFFNIDSQNYWYAGQRQARSMTCDVFQTVLNNFGGSSVVYEVYFLSNTTVVNSDRGSSSNGNPPQAIPFRIMTWAAGSLANQYEFHNFDQFTLDSRRFDISACFPGTQNIDFELFLHGPKNAALMPAIAPALQAMLSISVALNAGVTPIRIQKTNMHWGNTDVYYQGTLVGAPPSIAKYTPNLGQMMSSGLGKNVKNIATAADCATLCDTTQQAWSCYGFDYCASSQVCTLSKTTGALPLQSNPQCNHFQRVLGGGSVAVADLTTTWKNLRDAVYQGSVSFGLPLPDANGNVDLSVDTTTLDDTQKITFRAYKITDEVVNDGSRQGYSNVMDQFTSIPNKAGKGFLTSYGGVSVDDCANNCVGEQMFNCQSFHFCWDAGTCFLSNLHPDERPDMLKDSAGCDVYFRDYSTNFDLFAGVTALSTSNVIFQNVMSTSQCAKLCMYYSAFHCEGFDFCTDTNACYLGQTHYYDTPKASIQQSPACVHFSRNYLADFVQKTQQVVPLQDNRIISDVSASQCAKLCVEEGSFKCNSFDYCGNYSECRLSDVSLIGTGQTTLDKTAFCDVYLRQDKSTGAVASPSSSSSGYSKGAMAGLGIGMIVLGLVLTAVGYVVYKAVKGV